VPAPLLTPLLLRAMAAAAARARTLLALSALKTLLWRRAMFVPYPPSPRESAASSSSSDSVAGSGPGECASPTERERTTCADAGALCQMPDTLLVTPAISPAPPAASATGMLCVRTGAACSRRPIVGGASMLSSRRRSGRLACLSFSDMTRRTASPEDDRVPVPPRSLLLLLLLLALLLALRADLVDRAGDRSPLPLRPPRGLAAVESVADTEEAEPYLASS
jgi:hypothetical protein